MTDKIRRVWIRQTLFLVVIPFFVTLPFTWYFTGHVPEWTLDGFRPMAFAPKNDVLAVVSSHGPMGENGSYAPLRFLNARSGKEAQPELTLEVLVGSSIENWQRDVAKVEYSPQGDRIAVLLDQVMQPGNRELSVVDLATRKRIIYNTFLVDRVWADFQSALPAAIYSPDGKWLTATASSEGKRTTTVWDAESGREHFVLADQNQPIYSPDHKLLATTSYWRSISGSAVPKAIQLWELESGRLHSTLPLKGDVSGWNDGAVFSLDGRFVAANSRDNGKFIVQMFEVSTGKSLMSISGWLPHFLSEGETLRIVKDQSIQFWNIGKRSQVGSRKMELGNFWQDGTPFSPHPIQVPSKSSVLVADPNPPPLQSFGLAIATKVGLTGNNLVRVYPYFTCTTVLRVDGPSGRLQRLRYDGISMLNELVWTKDGNLCAMDSGKLSLWKFPPRKPMRYAYYALVLPTILLLLAWRGGRSKRRGK